MHCVQYVALSRADLQRWQNVRPHLMQASGEAGLAAPDGPDDEREEQRQRSRRASPDSSALLARIEVRVVAEERRAPRAAPAIARRHAHASAIGGV